MDEMRRMVAVLARGSQVPDIVVTTVAAGTPGTKLTPVMSQSRDQGRQAQQGGGGQQTRQEARNRIRSDRSSSNKRLREGEGAGEWREVTHQQGRKPRARPKAVAGTASLVEFNDLAGPEQFWIGNTRSSTNDDNMNEVLQKCARGLSVEDFSVEGVHCLLKEDNPRTIFWKVTVPSLFKELMANPAMYPQGWSHWAFHPGFRRQQGSAPLDAPAQVRCQCRELLLWASPQVRCRMRAPPLVQWWCRVMCSRGGASPPAGHPPPSPRVGVVIETISQ